ncbi:MAG: type II secretion system protein [Rickettsiales bacterium]
MKTRCNFNKNNHGFSLIELSVIVTVLALFAAGIMSTQRVTSETKKIDVTQDETKRIRDAIKHYFDKNGYIPCAARRDLPPENASFGLSTNCNAAAPSGTTDVTPGGGAGTDAVRIGMLPVRTLGLPEKYAFDQWDTRYTYATVKKLSIDSSTFKGFTTALTTGIIRVNTAAGVQMTPSSASTYTSYILISHGPDKRGAYSRAGTLINACGSTELDTENCDGDEVFIDAPVNDTVKGANYYYDLIDWDSNIVAPPAVTSYNGGYIVVISQQTHTYKGNFGGLSGGNTKCLAELNSQDWTYKDEATARGLLVPAKVRMFNCDTTTCQLTKPSTTYKFASTVSIVGGGAGAMYGGRTFTTNASGQGPGDTLPWNSKDAFGPDQGQWRSNIKAASTTLWALTPYKNTAASICNNWSSTSSALTSTVADWDSNPDFQGRFGANGGGSGSKPCSNGTAFVCLVDP